MLGRRFDNREVVTPITRPSKEDFKDMRHHLLENLVSLFIAIFAGYIIGKALGTLFLMISEGL